MRLCWSRSVWDPYRRRPHASPACSHSGEYPENMSGRRRGEMVKVNSASPFIRNRSWQLTYCATCHAYHHLQANTSRCISITSTIPPITSHLHRRHNLQTGKQVVLTNCLYTTCTQHVQTYQNTNRYGYMHDLVYTLLIGTQTSVQYVVKHTRVCTWFTHKYRYTTNGRYS